MPLASLLPEITTEAGAAGVFNLVHGIGEVVGAALVAHPGVPHLVHRRDHDRADDHGGGGRAAPQGPVDGAGRQVAVRHLRRRRPGPGDRQRAVRCLRSTASGALWPRTDRRAGRRGGRGRLYPVTRPAAPPPARPRSSGRGAPSCRTCRRGSSRISADERSTAPAATTSRTRRSGSPRSVGRRRRAPRLGHEADKGRSSHFWSGTAMTAASKTSGAPSPVLQLDRGDPLAAGLDHVLGPVRDGHVPPCVERSPRRRCGASRRGTSRVPARVGRPVTHGPRTSSSPTDHAVAGSSVPSSSHDADLDAGARCAGLASAVGRRCVLSRVPQAGATDAEPGCVSVIPQPWTMSHAESGRRTPRSASAATASRPRCRRAARKVAPVLVGASQVGFQIVGTPARRRSGSVDDRVAALPSAGTGA